MASASWPVGIPEIRLHLTDLNPEELTEEAKGWLLFEESQPTSTPEHGLRHRRALIEEWATASQEFRESYHNRAAGYTSALDYPDMVLSQLTPRSNKRFLCSNAAEPTTAPTTLSEILPALYLASADFHALSMARDGTVVFADGPDLTWFVIDAPELVTGRLTLVEFGSNGQARVSTLRRPWNMGQTMSFEQMLGKYLSEIAESGIGGPPQYNEPLDMDLPILELLESTRRANKFLYPGYGSRDMWVRIIEQSAPGYLELESQGKEVEFELDDLLVINP
ncbi:hypothetical protein BDV36DRAFT_307184 [Aspergillus pseudocaelatus]|uniref:Knr4/Smi1-like domain-containing protein n=1 Tax=Aspergillus pseudocaelatus TaxID=1825620 RepID=A0ABQ6WSQ0_9EURO|nr:hypothetical protein BDV36DRAFT_307184 [Aspergillus pseudocaelatus]